MSLVGSWALISNHLGSWLDVTPVKKILIDFDRPEH